MYSIYALYNQKNNKIYIGQTVDLKKRLIMHKNKTFKNSYTSRFDGEWNIIYNEEVDTREVALKREKQLKSYQGRKFIKRYIPG